MSDGDFEFRDEPAQAMAAPKAPKQVCAVKWNALKQCAEYVRIQAIGGTESRARQIAALLDQVGITPDFEPSEV